MSFPHRSPTTSNLHCCSSRWTGTQALTSRSLRLLAASSLLPLLVPGMPQTSAPRGATADSSALMQYEVGSRVLVEQTGEWWEAKVRAVRDEPGTGGMSLKVHYQGWHERWDMWVGADITRPWTEEAQREADEHNRRVREEKSTAFPKKRKAPAQAGGKGGGGGGRGGARRSRREEGAAQEAGQPHPPLPSNSTLRCPLVCCSWL